MDEELSAINPTNFIKTYGKSERVSVKTKPTILEDQVTSPSVNKREPLTTKNAVKFLLEGSLKSKVCRYCLNVASELSELDQILQMADRGTFYKVSIKDMIASFHPFKVLDDPNFPNKICNKCIDRTISSYLFTQQCERSQRALCNCFEDMYDKLEKLDPMERTKKRGRQKLNPNYNVLHAEHEKVIDYADPIMHIVHTASETLTEQPEIKQFECLKCCEILPNIESLINHTKIHPKSMWFNCRLCGKSFVKLYQLKRHSRNEHSSNDLPKTLEIRKFDCKKCGVVSETYYEHLQHIEKHKFKMVMEHLVERKMDKLCSICFGKGSNLVSLDKMICLHGNCPELTGNRPLYNILTSTLPENKNKYQELLVPTQASIIETVTKKKPGQKYTEFIFPEPSVLTAENLTCDDFYAFFFSSPLMLISEETIEFNDNELVLDKDTENLEMIHVRDDNACALDASSHLEIETKKYNIESSQNNDFMTDIQLDQHNTKYDPVKFQFSNPDFIELEDEVEKSKDKWIYNHSSAKDSDGVVNIDTDSNKDSKNDMPNSKPNPCKICWVFKHYDKCDHCKKSNNPVQTPKSIDIDKEMIEFNILVTNTNKDVCNISEENIIKAQETWQCNICLIHNNTDRETCDCCEAKPMVNINDETIFNKIMERKIDSNITNVPVSSEFKELNNNIILKKDKVAFNLNANLLCEFDLSSTFDSNINNILNVENVSHNKEINSNVISIEPEEVSLMDTEIIESENTIISYNSFTNDEPEAMDIEDTQTSETNLNIHTNNVTIRHDIIFNTMCVPILPNEQSPINNDSFIKNQFQFAIGTGSSGESQRKNKRAARNMTRSHRK